MVETSPSTSAGAASPTDESTGTARYGVYMRATTAGVCQRLFSSRCDRKYRAQMEARLGHWLYLRKEVDRDYSTRALYASVQASHGMGE